MSEDLEAWNRRLQHVIAERGLRHFHRVVVVARTTSTQDAALRLAARPGTIVLADQQTGGRGRLGRRWYQGSRAGLVLTFVLEESAYAPEELAIAAGVALAETIASLLQPLGITVGLRWPNDVVVVRDGRKLAGVLVECRQALALLGVGVNVAHSEADWPADLASSAVSLAQLGWQGTRIDVAEQLLIRLCSALDTELARLIPTWQAYDVLMGARARFESNGREYSGIVEAVEPSAHIVLRCDDGTRMRLPAMTTSLIAIESPFPQRQPGPDG